LVTAYLYKVI